MFSNKIVSSRKIISLESSRLHSALNLSLSKLFHTNTIAFSSSNKETNTSSINSNVKENKNINDKINQNIEFDPPNPNGGNSAFSKASSGFKMLNPELFIKPTKSIYIPGTILFLISVGILIYTIIQERMDQNMKNFMEKQKSLSSSKTSKISNVSERKD